MCFAFGKTRALSVLGKTPAPNFPPALGLYQQLRQTYNTAFGLVPQCYKVIVPEVTIEAGGKFGCAVLRSEEGAFVFCRRQNT